jgi:signal transduction histidine kinase
VALLVSAPDPVRGTWDAGRIDQVVTNLVSNALKYGAGRPIEVSIRAEPPRGVVVVRDYGLGIANDDQDRVFGPFARAVPARHYAGLGLGLWISQQIAQASGGLITMESRLGEGSTFRLELPL